MTNILIPVNKNVSPLYKNYPFFLTKLAEFLKPIGVNVTLLQFSDLLSDLRCSMSLCLLGVHSLADCSVCLRQTTDSLPAAPY